MPPLFAQHLIDDAKFQADVMLRFESLATKDDTKEILGAIKKVHIGFGVVRLGWKSFLTIGAITGSLVAIVAFWKLVLVWLIGIIIK